MSNSIAGDTASTQEPMMFAPEHKTWIFPQETNAPDHLVEVALGSKVLAGLLWNRGVRTVEEARKFLDETSYVPTSFSELPDVDKAAERILKAIETKQHVTIYGDYDVDGVTGTAVLLTVLKELGAEVDYYIPNRISEGYGLNLKALSILASKKKTKLIVTCDCGVSNFAEINFARSLSVDTVVLDHHTMPEVLPPAVAVVHPKLLDENHPLYHLPGVGVAYKVCEALLAASGRQDQAADLLDFVTLGMIADLVPLVRENRYLVKIGLEKLVKTKRIGLKALLAQVSGQNDTDLVGFGIAPRINAAGRLSDANKAVELLTTADEKVAADIAQELQVENARRQELCEKIFAEANARVQRQLDLENQKCIAIYDRDWHHGVVGIVASRLVEKYHRPVFIGQLDAEEGIVKGSARGVEQLDLYEVLKANEHLLSRWGGHKMAAGFTVEYNKADELCRSLIATCNRMLEGKPLAGTVEIDLLVEPDKVDLTLAKQLRVLAPFGMANRKPRLCMKELKCAEVRDLGKEGKHTRMMLAGPGETKFEAVMWNSKGRVPNEGTTIDLVFSADVNNFNGKERLQLVVNDWRSQRSAGGTTSGEPASLRALPVSDTTIGATPSSQMPVARTISGATPSSGTPVAGTVSGAAVNSSNGELAELARAAEDLSLTRRDTLASIKQVWRDLRGNERPLEIVKKGFEKLQGRLSIFAEAASEPKGYKLHDRLSLEPTKHLMFWQFPPSASVFRDILARTMPENVYLIGYPHGELDDSAAYLKRLYGLVRYAVNQRDGKVESEKLTALMGSTKMTLALALGVLKSVHLVDWFAEDGIINLDCLGNAQGAFDDCAEFQQFSQSLDESKAFRKWCSVTPVKEIQLALMRHGVSLSATSSQDAIGENSAQTRTGSQKESRELAADEVAESVRAELPGSLAGEYPEGILGGGNDEAKSLEQRINEIYDNSDE